MLALVPALIVLAIVFQNQMPVRTRLQLRREEMPCFVLLTVVCLPGVVTGRIAFWRSRRPSD